ncbi:MAG: undecaprenyldiphospho-muramoylpentapeptide beta-N-acetylglucosaminyltransferase [Bacteroidales bacterium]|nr:undecaprenyldiphospho-muramoylpentapeptide beta-N-acetylglucosaminyltransferase [Bacteroidales bacterium]
MQQPEKRIIISGGGSGGHIFPAIAIANAMKETWPNAKILFIGAKGKMEMEKVPQAGYPIEGLWISGLQRKLSIQNISFPLKLISSMLKARKIIKRFQPDLVVGVGGFASGPTLQQAATMKIPTLVQEQNSYPGITNIWLSKKVDKICVSYDGLDKFFPKEKIYLTGNPVRKNVVDIADKREEAARFFNLDPEIKTVLVVGGSLGARTINEAIESKLDEFSKNGIQLIWQTGINYYPQAANAILKTNDPRLKVFQFIHQMDLAYAMADIVISRAGAIAISELCLVGKPVILVPSPFVAEDHQTKNALALVTYNAAVLVKDQELKEKLWPELNALINDIDRQEKLKANIKALGKPDATESIIAVAKTLIR